jgi:hypothetical protein
VGAQMKILGSKILMQLILTTHSGRIMLFEKPGDLFNRQMRLRPQVRSPNADSKPK